MSSVGRAEQHVAGLIASVRDGGATLDGTFTSKRPGHAAVAGTFTVGR